jgi:hypothetical protein
MRFEGSGTPREMARQAGSTVSVAVKVLPAKGGL